MKRGTIEQGVAYWTADGKHWPTFEEAERQQFRLDLIDWLNTNHNIYWREPDVDVVADELIKHFNITPKDEPQPVEAREPVRGISPQSDFDDAPGTGYR
jgi:hypothetical protein